MLLYAFVIFLFNFLIFLNVCILHTFSFSYVFLFVSRFG